METIIYVDIETLGTIAGIHPMISIGAVAFNGDKEIGSFKRHISWQPGELGLVAEQDTVDWWKSFPDQLETILKGGEDVEIVINDFYDWCLGIEGPKVFAAWPPIFDISFLRWYVAKICPQYKQDKFFSRFNTIDIRSYVAMYYGINYSDVKRDSINPDWVKKDKITHDPLDDARWQASVLINILGVN